MEPITIHLKKGLKISFITKYCDIFIQIIITAILARLLKPSDYGLFAIVVIFINFAQLIAEIGIGPAIIQNNELDIKDISMLFLFTLFQGLIMAIVYYFLSFLIFFIYRHQIFLDSRIDIGIIIFISSITTVPLGILRKKLDFFYLGFFTIWANVIAGLGGIFFALKGFGVYSLIYKTIISGILMFVFFYIKAKIKISFKFNPHSLNKIKNYSLNQFGFNIITYIARNIDNLLIGKVIGTSALGIYDRAYKLMMYPIQNLTLIINPVLHPVLTKIRDDKDQLRKTYLKVLRLLSLISIPLIAVLYIFSKDIILIFYGPNWLESVKIFKILCFVSGLQVLSITTSSIFQAAGRPDLLFKTGLFSNIILVIGILVGLKWGIEGVAWGYLISYLITIIPIFFILFSLLNGHILEILEVVKTSTVICVIILIILGLSMNIFRISNLYLRFGTFVTIGVFVYMSLLVLFKQHKFIANALKH